MERVCCCLLVFAQRTPYTTLSLSLCSSHRILQLNIVCSFVRPIIYFVRHSNSHYFGCVLAFFLDAGSNRLFDIFDTICYFGLFTRIPESDSVVCSVLFLWFRSLLFHSNIKHLIAMAHEINRLTTTRAREKRTKKRKPNNNYFHFCGNKLFVVHKLIVQSDLAHSSSSTSTSSWLKTSTAHE